MHKDSLTIRAYTRDKTGHRHDYHQLVLPIKGMISIELDGYQGQVSVGECVIIQAGVHHLFKADEEARFIVADLNQLPANLLSMDSLVFSISTPLKSFLSFIECQLEHRVDKGIEALMRQMFSELLAQQQADEQVDVRVREVINYIAADLSLAFNISDLAAMVYLSPTQFKKVFKSATNQSVMHYITEQRMKKAKALLTHTDAPVQLIADQVGYNDISAFSRRFSHYFGVSPRQIRS